MISPELNKTLTEVGSGTPGGELMRRYWHPIAATFRDPAKNVCIELNTERVASERGAGPGWKYSPLTPEIRRLFEEAKAAGAR